MQANEQLKSSLQTQVTKSHTPRDQGGGSRNNQRYAIAVHDWPPNGIKLKKRKRKTSQETAGNLRTFLEPEENPKVVYTDNSLEFGKLVKIKGIIVRLHLVVLTQMELQKEQQEE